MKKKIVLDLETTGLDPEYDEILQLSIINAADGSTIINTLIEPEYCVSWSEAENVHGISRDDVKGKPKLVDLRDQLIELLDNTKTVIGYNTYFDLGFLEEGLGYHFSGKVVDVMREFAPVFGERSEYYGNWKWQKLVTAASYYHYDWGEGCAHDSLDDCKATLFVYNKMHPDANEDDDWDDDDWDDWDDD